MIAVICRQNQIQADIDEKNARAARRSLRKTLTALNILERETGFRYRAIEAHHSKSGKGIHVTVTLPGPLPAIERIFFACLLGSDKWRELLNYVRVCKRSPKPILFWEKGKRRGKALL